MSVVNAEHAWPLAVFAALSISLWSPTAGGQELAPPTKRVVQALTELIQFEIQDKALHGLSIALIKDKETVWSKGFGEQSEHVPATPQTAYRVGSVSKLFTNLAVMQLVEAGKLTLDDPVTTYLEDFKPTNPFATPVTLRHLMTHRSGLVREPPVGHYFDASAPSLTKTVKSLDSTTLLFEPGSKTKYSNAGLAVVGRVLESVSGHRRFESLMRDALIVPVGMTHSDFSLTPAIQRNLATGWMWSYDRRRFEAPTFQLGTGPAGNLFSTVEDLAQFLKVIFNRGMGPKQRVIKEETLSSMLKPQFGGRYGLGFALGNLKGQRTHGHNGAVYGFSTHLSFVHQQKIGVVVAASTDVCNAVLNHIGKAALSMMLAQKNDEPLPQYRPTRPLVTGLARLLEGRYEFKNLTVDLVERNDELFCRRGTGYHRVRLRDRELICDDRQAFGPTIKISGHDEIKIRGIKYSRITQKRPLPPNASWAGLIGEYGWDHNIMFVYEHFGQLHALVEWTEINPLTPNGKDRFSFPTSGCLYKGEDLVFQRNTQGKAIQATCGGIVMPRRHLKGESGKTFVIDAVKSEKQLRQLAAEGTPPQESGDFKKTDLVDLIAMDKSIALDIRYASKNNFLQMQFYNEPRAFLQKDAAEALVKAHAAMKKHGFGFLIHDAYRPWFVTKMFFDATSESQKIFVADPAKGSRHNRGCAVDLTLIDLATGKPVAMTGLYDEFTERSFPDYQGGSHLQRWHRELLRDVMEDHGFSVYEWEWWHFDFGGWEKYRIGNAAFDEIGPGKNH